MNGLPFWLQTKISLKIINTLVHGFHADQPNSLVPQFAELVTQRQICHPEILLFFFEIIWHI
jgi:hypothetical protein